MKNQIDWFNVGDQYYGGVQHEYEAMCRRVTWERLPVDLPMIPGEAIKDLIKEFKIPKVSHVAHSHELAPYGLIAVRGHYQNAGEVDVFAVWDGCSITPICAHRYLID